MLEWISSLTDKQIALAAAAAAIGSFLTAAPAFIYSRRATKAAERANAHAGKANELAGEANDLAKDAVTKADVANRISLHPHQKELFLAFNQLHLYMRANMERGSVSEVQHFNPHVITCRLYVPPSLADDIEAYVEACYLLFDLASREQDRRMTLHYETHHRPESVTVFPNEQESVESLRMKQEEARSAISKTGDRVVNQLATEIRLVQG